MNVNVRFELRHYVREHVFRNDEIDLDIVIFPEFALSAHGPVRTTADQESLFFSRPSHHVHSQDSRWVAYLQGSVNV
jgi:hypothetical protein